jgi:hypothetical protein
MNCKVFVIALLAGWVATCAVILYHFKVLEKWWEVQLILDREQIPEFENKTEETFYIGYLSQKYEREATILTLLPISAGIFVFLATFFAYTLLRCAVQLMKGVRENGR